MDKVFIAGKVGDGSSDISDEVLKQASIKFKDKQLELESLGYLVVNPMELEPIGGNEWEHFMRATIRELCTCDYVHMLDDWDKSKGAKIEVGISDILEIKKLYI